jgi:hypothetical protein
MKLGVKRWPVSWSGPLLPGLIVALAGCAQTPAVVRRAAPPISSIQARKAPSPQQLPVEDSKPVAANPQAALANYRAVLKLNPDPATREETLRRIADLEVQIQDQKGNPTSGQQQVDSAIGTYKKLLRENPNSPDNPRLLYQMARAYQNSGHTDQAIKALEVLESRYPNSSLIGDAHYRAGQLAFQTHQYAKAASDYRYVMDLGSGSPRYQDAQYMYGWSLYKQGDYDSAIAEFFHILDRNLPKGELSNPKTVLQSVPAENQDVVSNTLRVVSLSFAAEGGGKAVNAYFAKHGEPRYYPLVYNALGGELLKKQRYTDAANAFRAFIKRHPTHPEAPAFQSKVIDAYKAGGFGPLVLKATETYVDDYAADAPYWKGRKPDPAVIARVRTDLERLGQNYQAEAQKLKKDEAKRDADYARAAHWYRRILQLYPHDPHAADINLALADSLYAGGQTQKAAEEYEKTAYGYGNDNPKAADAALAAVQAWQKLADQGPKTGRPAALKGSVAASLKLAKHFPAHPAWTKVLSKAAVDQFELGDLNAAAGTAQRVLASGKPLDQDLRRTDEGVIADARFKQGKFAEAEKAYTVVLQLTPSNSADRKTVVDQLAASIYQQAQAAQKAGDLKKAADLYLHVGEVVPEAALRSSADYDASAALIKLKDWPRAEQVLEGFRSRDPHSKLIPDVDKKLAYAYQQDHKPLQAARVFERIAARSSESPDTRRDAAWLAASLFDKAGQTRQAERDYISYVKAYPEPLDRAMQARRRIADIARDSGDDATARTWLKNIVGAYAQAGNQADLAARTQAAQASIELARTDVQRANAIALMQPLKNSLAARKTAMDKAINRLTEAAGYGIADVTTEATYDLGELYDRFGHDLEHSEAPSSLTGDALSQYRLLLQTKAEPFYDKAIKTHEANLQRVAQGVYNPWIARSVAMLAKLAPGKYGKRERAETHYDHLR